MTKTVGKLFGFQSSPGICEFYWHLLSFFFFFIRKKFVLTPIAFFNESATISGFSAVQCAY